MEKLNTKLIAAISVGLAACGGSPPPLPDWVVKEQEEVRAFCERIGGVNAPETANPKAVPLGNNKYGFCWSYKPELDYDPQIVEDMAQLLTTGAIVDATCGDQSHEVRCNLGGCGTELGHRFSLAAPYEIISRGGWGNRIFAGVFLKPIIHCKDNDVSSEDGE